MKKLSLLLYALLLLLPQLSQAYFDPSTGTWISRDPLGEAGGVNLYAFCNNDPVNFVDPDGLNALNIGGFTDRERLEFFAYTHFTIDEFRSQFQFAQRMATMRVFKPVVPYRELKPVPPPFVSNVPTIVAVPLAIGDAGLNFGVIAAAGDQGRFAMNYMGSPFNRKFKYTAPEINLIYSQLAPAINDVLFTLMGARAGNRSLVRIPEYLVVRSPNNTMRAAVQGSYISPFTNTERTYSRVLSADHIVSQSVIANLPKFQNLTASQQEAVLNFSLNFQGLPMRMNSSKGSKSASEWTHYKGRPLSPQYIQDQSKLEEILTIMLRVQIQEYARMNYEATNPLPAYDKALQDRFNGRQP